MTRTRVQKTMPAHERFITWLTKHDEEFLATVLVLYLLGYLG